MGYRIAVDTGGTFTDVVIADEAGRLIVGKALTTTERTFEGFREALANAGEIAGVAYERLLAETEMLIYGTTRSTNSIIEGKVAKTALLTTEGFPDTLLYRHGGKREPLNLAMEFPPPYIPRRLTFEIPERINAEGGVERELDEAAARAIIESLPRKRIEAVAVALLWSIVNPDHELRIGALIAEIMPGVPYTLSHQLNPIIREFPRTSSTAIDASLKPLMQSHLAEFESDLRAAGCTGEVLISTSSGGVMHVDDVVAKPIYTVKSGPAMGPLAGIAYGGAEDQGDDVIIVDTGGTTFDVSLVRSGQVKYTRDTWLLGEWIGHNLGLSSVDVRSVGAGGGSIAWIDAGGLLRVGPQSAGARPGPACYGQGGEEPTVTDAAVVLGYIDPDYFLGGRMRLDVAAAADVLEKVAVPLKLSADEAASALLTLAGEQMIKAIQEITVQDGVNPRREHHRRRRWRGRAQHHPHRPGPRLPSRAAAAHGGRAQRLRRAVLQHRHRVQREPLCAFEHLRLRRCARDALRHRPAHGRVRGEAARPQHRALRARVFRRGPLHQPAVGDGDSHAHGPLRGPSGRGAAGGDLPRCPFPPLCGEGRRRRHRVHQLEGPDHGLPRQAVVPDRADGGRPPAQAAPHHAGLFRRGRRLGHALPSRR